MFMMFIAYGPSFPIFWDLVRFARWDQKLTLNKNPHESHRSDGYGCPMMPQKGEVGTKNDHHVFFFRSPQFAADFRCLPISDEAIQKTRRPRK